MAAVTAVVLEAEDDNNVQASEASENVTDVSSAEEPKHTKSTSIAIQANDYEIERGSGVLPARRRIIPFKFRDYHDPTVVIKEEVSDDEYSPAEPAEPKKKTKYGRPGRPRKNPADHTYEKGGENGGNTTNAEATDVDPALVVPKRGRPTKNDVRGESDKVFRCPTCKKGFSQKGNLKVHQKIHSDERPFTCDHDNCGKAFRANEALKRHKLSHLGIKLFKCEVCTKNFSSNVALKEHMSRHTNDKPHACPHCEKKFRQISCMRRHVLTHTDIKPYECPICKMRFSQMIYVRSHMKRHTGEKPFKCVICEKSFAHHSDLNRHKTVHSGEKPYDCEVCGAKFTDPSSRRRHVKEHFGFKPYQCTLCGDNFKRADQLKSHLTKKHDCKIANGPMEMMDNTSEAEAQPKETAPGMHVLTDAMGNVFQVVHDKGVIQLLQQEIDVTQEQSKEGSYQMQELIRHLENGEEVQVVQQIGNQIADASSKVQEMGAGQVQVLQVAESPRDQPQQVILTPAPGQEAQELLQEQTEQILAQIRSQLQEQSAATEDGLPVQVSYQIIHDDENQQIVEIQYINAGQEGESDNSQSEQVSEPIRSVPSTLEAQPTVSNIEFANNDIAMAEPIDNAATDNSAVVPPDYYTTSPDVEKNELNPQDSAITTTEDSQSSSADVISSNYISKPDFNSQDYYNWLSNFTELCKVETMPLEVQLFQNISHVHKTLSDVLANPKGILTNRENFRTLMSISTELNSVINNHLSFVLEKLNNEESSESL